MAGASLLAASSARAQGKSVTVGYQTIVGPFPTAIAAGAFEKGTGYKIDWRQFTSAGHISSALASGDVPVGVLGSTGIAAAVTRGVDIELFWILDDIGRSEALVARNGSGINGPQDLKGKKVAVPFVSTSHFHLLVALDQVWHVKPSDVQILNMKPPQIVAAWARGDIDAAYVWPPALSEIMKNGKTIITSEEVGKKSVPTFDGLVVSRSRAKKNTEFMNQFAKVLATAYADYGANKAKWTADSPQVKGMVKLVGGSGADAAEALHLLGYPNVQEQLSAAWLGGGALRALTESAKFLHAQRQIDKVLPSYAEFVNASFAKAAAK
ncbi:MAG: taurine ABC transporter substrate-binding protein [Ideonella sp.]|nr:taurine ABC transporter substrate-binding protein [Ideonella sp.]MCC7457150.1 taurine ABC transporter substrate-binding protein [Nitrospira sp.]